MIISLGITCDDIQEIKGLEHIKSYDVFSIGKILAFSPSLQRIESRALLYDEEETVALFPVSKGDTVICFSSNSYYEIMLLVKYGVKVYLIEPDEKYKLTLAASL
jgi:hypothetical protein